MSKTGKRIPISTAKAIASDFGYSQVIIHAYDVITHIQHVTTFGKSEMDCENDAVNIVRFVPCGELARRVLNQGG